MWTPPRENTEDLSVLDGSFSFDRNVTLTGGNFSALGPYL